MRRRRVLQMIGAAIPALATRPMRLARAAELDEVRVGTPLTISDAPIFIAEAKGYCREQGIKTAMTSLQTGAYMVAPLGAGQLDVAAAATSAGLFNSASRRHRHQDHRRQGFEPAGLRLCLAAGSQGAGRTRGSSRR